MVGLEDADVILVGGSDQAFAGWSVAGAGDVDGDGLDDLAIGTPGLSWVWLGREL